MQHPEKDVAMGSIRLHPAAIFLLLVILAGLTDSRWPVPIAALPAIHWLGVALLIAGGSAILLAYRALLRAGTHIDPSRPTTRVVSGGIYAYSRNPVYLGLCLVVAGWGLQKNSLIFFASAFLLGAALWRVVIQREEAYLEKKFGDEYLRYKNRVRRWL